MESGKPKFAIVGLAVRLPGGVKDYGSLVELLHAGQEAISDVPTHRWNIDDYYSSDPDEPGTMYTRRAGFLDDSPAAFDAGFFGITPSEARYIDPQQRILLETTWHAIEDAGTTRGEISSIRSGVYVGAYSHDYEVMATQDLEHLSPYSVTGLGASSLAGRVSFSFNLRGPSMVIDTASSSSLVALHVACGALRTDEIDVAIVGGINLILSPAGTIAFCKARTQSADGRCKAFDESADGYVRGEGCVVLVVKRLDRVDLSRERIYAVIEGTAVNQDGHSESLVAPSEDAQVEVLQAALRAADVRPDQVGAIETHGTGTRRGDQTEVNAIRRVFASSSRTAPIYLGSFKTYIGHLESAAGLASVVKACVALDTGVLHRNLNLLTPDRTHRFEEIPADPLQKTASWQQTVDARIVGVSSFGISGTNAHAILSHPARHGAVGASISARPTDDKWYVLKASARTERALVANLQALNEAVKRCPDEELRAFCDLQARCRDDFELRELVVGQDRSRLSGKLTEAIGRARTGSVHRSVNSRTVSEAETVFLLTGQGSQYVGMGRGLYRGFSAFRRVFDECVSLVSKAGGPNLTSVLLEADDPSLLSRTDITQPLIFAFEVACAELWRSFGIRPNCMIGHSVGEYAAAFLGGVMSLEDAANLITLRGRLMQSLPQGGGMIATALTFQQAQELIADSFPAVCIAAVNSNAALVLAGPSSDLNRIAELLTARKQKATTLRVSHAFHSSLMAPVLDEFANAAAKATYRPSRIPIFSTLTGRRLGPTEPMDASYWVQHIKEPVLFHQAVLSTLEAGPRTFVEVGPGSSLCGLVKTIDEAAGAIALPSTTRERPEPTDLLDSLAELYRSGVDIEWKDISRTAGVSRSVMGRLPAYQFDRQEHWLPAQSGGDVGLKRKRAAIERIPIDGTDAVLVRRVLSSSGLSFGEEGVLAPSWLIGSVASDLSEAGYDRVGMSQVEVLSVPSVGAQSRLIQHQLFPRFDSAGKMLLGDVAGGLGAPVLTYQLSVDQRDEAPPRLMDIQPTAVPLKVFDEHLQHRGWLTASALNWIGAVDWLGSSLKLTLNVPESSANPIVALVEAVARGIQFLRQGKSESMSLELIHSIASLRIHRLSHGPIELFVAEGDGGIEARAYQNGRAVLEMAGVRTSQGLWMPRVQSNPSDLAKAPASALFGLSQDEISEKVSGILKACTAELLGLSKFDGLSYTTSLREQGVSSLLAVELRNRIQAAIGGSLKLPATILLDFPSLKLLEEYIMSEILDSREEKKEGDLPISEDDLDSLSKDELEALLQVLSQERAA